MRLRQVLTLVLLAISTLPVSPSLRPHQHHHGLCQPPANPSRRLRCLVVRCRLTRPLHRLRRTPQQPTRPHPLDLFSPTDRWHPSLPTPRHHSYPFSGHTVRAQSASLFHTARRGHSVHTRWLVPRCPQPRCDCLRDSELRRAV